MVKAEITIIKFYASFLRKKFTIKKKNKTFFAQKLLTEQ